MVAIHPFTIVMGSERPIGNAMKLLPVHQTSRPISRLGTRTVRSRYELKAIGSSQRPTDSRIEVRYEHKLGERSECIPQSGGR